MMSKIKHWIPAILYMVLIFYLSSRPAAEAFRRFPIIAKLKLVHIIEYGFLFFLIWRAITMTTKYNIYERFSLSLMITVLYGLTDEFHQIFIVSRTASLADVVADGVGGVLVGLGINLRNKGC